jgi:hypothetical protein
VLSSSFLFDGDQPVWLKKWAWLTMLEACLFTVDMMGPGGIDDDDLEDGDREDEDLQNDPVSNVDMAVS